MADDPVPQRTVERVIVQSANELAANDGGWTTRSYLRYLGGDDPHGTIMGTARFEQIFGMIHAEGTNAFQHYGVTPNLDGTDTLPSLAGLYVRLLVRDDAGTIALEGDSFKAFWWGQFVDPDETDDGGETPSTVGGGASWFANGIQSILHQIRIREGFELASDLATVVDPGYLPAFNQFLNGDRSAAMVTIGGRTTYVHDRFTGADPLVTSHLWSAVDIVRLLLVAAAKPILKGIGSDADGHGMFWTIYDPLGALDYQPHRLDLNGKSVLEAINELIPAHRGLDWYVTILHDQATITVTTGVATAIVTPLYTLPAALITVDVTWAGDVWQTGRRLLASYANTYDVVEIRGSKPWVGITGWWDLAHVDVAVGGASWCSFAKGWTADDETDYEEAHSDADGHMNPTAAIVWRRFRIKNDWDGQQYNDSTNGLRNVLAVSAANDPLYGTGGYTGAREYDENKPTPPAYAYELTRELPVLKGFVSGTAVGQKQEPLMIVGSGVTWSDVSETVQFQTDDEPPVVLLGSVSDDAQTSGQLILFTFGIRESHPLRVSWQRARADWPRDTPRVMVIDIPDFQEWRILAGTVIRVEHDATIIPLPNDYVLRDDTNTMRSYLALILPIYRDPEQIAEWTNRGVLDTSTDLRSGALLATLTRGKGDTTVNSTITRSWQYVPETGDMPAHYDTSYRTSRLAPDFRPV